MSDKSKRFAIPYSSLWLWNKSERQKRRKVAKKRRMIERLINSLFERTAIPFISPFESTEIPCISPFVSDEDDESVQSLSTNEEDEPDWLDQTLDRFKNVQNDSQVEVRVGETNDALSSPSPSTARTFASCLKRAIVTNGDIAGDDDEHCSFIDNGMEGVDEWMRDPVFDGNSQVLNVDSESEESRSDNENSSPLKRPKQNVSFASGANGNVLVEVRYISDDDVSTGEEPVMKICHIADEEAIIVLNSGSDRSFPPFDLRTGDLVVTSVSGSVCLNGYRLREKQRVTVSTGFKNFVIRFTNCRNEDNIIEKELKHKLKAFKLGKEEVKQITDAIEGEDHSKLAVFHLKKLQSFPLMVLETLIGGRSLREKNWFKFELQSKTIPVNTTWETTMKQQLLPRLTRDSIVLVCGPKNSGKSSLIRWLINAELSESQQQVYYVDCDPGQCEFSPPGVISGTVVDEPILCPPFVSVIRKKNLVNFHSASVGGINVARDPDLYLTNFRCLWEKTIHFLDFCGKKPIFINTMGWMSDIGLQLLVDIIKTVRPTDLIEIRHQQIETDNSGNEMKMTPACVANLKSWSNDHMHMSVDESDVHFNYIELEETFKLRNERVIKEAIRDRQYAQMAYLSICKEAVYKPLEIVTPYRVYWKDVFVHIVSDCPPDVNIVLDILNCSWVQLCRVRYEEELQVDEDSIKLMDSLDENMCIGCGIIHSINADEHCFYIITPEPIDRLKDFNCIVKPSGISIPEQVMLKELCGAKRY